MPVLMIQGTASHVGKSTLVTALCRIAADAGYRVAPFKAQNMSLNAAVTPDGGEIGRAQYTQAEAARVVPTVRMNPILLKPTDDQRSQVVVLGRATTQERAAEYYERREALWPIVTESLDALIAEHDLVIIEGAGSPAEINLASREIVNMRVALYARAPVILVGDIERGGVFAALYGTVSLLSSAERALVQGFVINKFRGDPTLIHPGPEMLAERTGIPTLGVIPYTEIGIPEEDTLGVPTDRVEAPVIDIAVIHFPHMANFDDFDPLRRERGVGVRFVERVEQLGRPDLIVLPGTKTTIADLAWLRERGFDKTLSRDMPILGICGGYQMLGREIRDPLHVESEHDCVDGLGLLDAVTTFEATKTTRQRALGYEIHNGTTEGCSTEGRISGTYVHGLFEDPLVRRAMLQQLAASKGVELALGPLPPTRDDVFDALAEHVAKHCDVNAMFKLAGLAC
jgi:adenosylcobyric acid synthase